MELVGDRRSASLLGDERSHDEGWQGGFKTTVSHDAATRPSVHLRSTSMVVGLAH